MTTFIALVITVLAFAFIVYPFYRRRLRGAESHEDEQVAELLSKRDTSYSMLKELEFDYKSGILSEKDYQELEARYKKKAINILKDLDGAQESPKVADEIEEQVNKLRRNKTVGRQPEDDIEKEVLQLRREKVSDKQMEDHVEEEVRELRRKPNYCSNCGTKTREGDLFCSQCGAKLT